VAQALVGCHSAIMHPMRRLLVPALLIGTGIACLAVAPSAQFCVTWSDGSACETAATIVLNVLGLALIGIGGLWLVVRSRRAGA
jgi:hypothetical protein